MTQPIHIHQHEHGLTKNGYIIDARIAWWKVQTRTQAIVVSVCGELDASNTDRFDQCLRELASGGEPFVIDLGAVTFIGIQCFRSLLRLANECQASRTSWALVVTPQTRPQFDVVDPADCLPVMHTLSEAIISVAPTRRPALRLVASSKRRASRSRC